MTMTRYCNVLHINTLFIAYFQEFEPEDLGKLIETLKQLATDSTKSRSKKDRKEQRYGDKNI